MGIRFSVSSQPSKPGLGELPESCVAVIMEYMDPPQICKLAYLNRAFRAASSADFIWESKLPPNYDVIISKIFDTYFPSHLGKRGIYSHLCSPNTFDGGTKVINRKNYISFIVFSLFIYCFYYYYCRKFGWIEAWV
jgi:hypothetical protein